MTEEFQRHFQRADQLARQGNYIQATQCFLQALNLSPEHPQALFGLASVLRLQQKYPEAIQKLERLIEQWPNNTHYLIELANTWFEQGHLATDLGGGMLLHINGCQPKVCLVLRSVLVLR